MDKQNKATKCNDSPKAKPLRQLSITEQENRQPLCQLLITVDHQTPQPSASPPQLQIYLINIG